MLVKVSRSPRGSWGAAGFREQEASSLTACVCLFKYSTKEDKYEEEIKLLEEKLKEVRLPLRGN